MEDQITTSVAVTSELESPDVDDDTSFHLVIEKALMRCIIVDLGYG